LFGGGGHRSDEQLLLDELLPVFRAHFDPLEQWEMATFQIWASWVMIEAPPEMHEQFERFLAMTEAASVEGGSR
jgi:hypothetical protein